MLLKGAATRDGGFERIHLSRLWGGEPAPGEADVGHIGATTGRERVGTGGNGREEKPQVRAHIDDVGPGREAASIGLENR